MVVLDCLLLTLYCLHLFILKHLLNIHILCPGATVEINCEMIVGNLLKLGKLQTFPL